MINRENPGRSSKPAVGKPQKAPIQLLVLGVIVLQVVVVILVLVTLAPADRQPGLPDRVEALDVPPVIEAEPVGSEPPARLDETPPPPLPAAILPPTPEPTPSATAFVAPPEVETVSTSPILRLRGVEITQGIQVFNEPELPNCVPDPNHPNYIFCNNSMPLVAGRHTLVRVYPACAGECPALDVTVRLRVLKDGQEQTRLTRQLSADTLQRINDLPLPDLRFKLENSVNFEFFPPPDWMVGQITFEVETVPLDTAAPAAVALSLSQEFAVRKPLRVAYLPIQYQNLTPPEPAEIEYWLQRMYPVPDVDYYRLPVPDMVWEGDLNKGNILGKLLFTYWLYAQYQPVSDWPDQLFGWLPQEFYNGGVSDPFWCPTCAGPHSSRVAFGGLRPEQDIGGPRILVHEIAHNLGAQHAWSPTQAEDTQCFKPEGADIRVDPDWPYAQTPHIQEFGIDLYSNPPVIYPPAYYDMMAYCTQPWISPHTYHKIFESPFLQPDAAASLPLANFQPQLETSESGTLLVSGVVYPDGTVSQPEIVRLAGEAFSGSAGAFNPPAFTPPPGDDYCLEAQAADNRTVARHCFDIGFDDLETDEPAESSPFLLALPETDGQEISQVTISKNDVALVIVTPSNTPPDIAVTFPNGGEVLDGQQTVTWEAHDADGDPLSYELLYSADGGQSWLPLAVRLDQTEYTLYTSQLPASDNALIRVIASDGFHTSVDESDYPFSVEAPAENSISLHGPASIQPGQRFDVTVIVNRIAEPGLFGVQFKLDFDPTLLQVDTLHLHPDLSLVVDDSIDNGRGQVSIVASRQGQVPNLTGDLTLATLTFVSTSTGEAYLNLDNFLAGARGGEPLPIPKVQGLSLYIAE